MAVRPVGRRGAAPTGRAQVLRSPVGGHVWAVYFGEGPAVQAGDLLLKLVVGTGSGAHLGFGKALAAGRVAALGISPGPYRAARPTPGSPYPVP